MLVCGADIATDRIHYEVFGWNARLGSKPISIIMFDEVDGYPHIPVWPDAVSIPRLIDGDPVWWQPGDVRVHLAGPYARRGWASRCIDRSIGLWETFRLSKRAARRRRGRSRAEKREALRRAGELLGRAADRPPGALVAAW